MGGFRARLKRTGGGQQRMEERQHQQQLGPQAEPEKITLGERKRRQKLKCRLCWRIIEEEAGAREVYAAEEKSVMTIAVEDTGIISLNQTDQHHQVSNIPFEIVDDDEMAAIETAFRQAHSVSFAYHATNRVAPAVVPSSKFRFPQPSNETAANLSMQYVHSRKPSHSFVYTVASESWSTPAPATISRAQHGAPCSTVASVTTFRAQNGSPSPAVGDASPSQSPVNYESAPSLQLEGADEEVAESNPLPVALALDESPNPRLESFQKGTCVISAEQSSVISGNSSFVRESAVHGQIPEDSQDIEDFVGMNARASSSNGRSRRDWDVVGRTSVTLLQRKAGRGLAVTDFTASEWCEKQVEFSLNRGKPEQTTAMKAGSARHDELEQEVVTRVEIEIHTKEDTWAVRLLNFVSGARQLLSEGLTRELPVLGIVGGTWVVGIIDEIRLVQTELGEQPLLVDTKTRRRRVPPSEPQKRNARLQLMCYKLLWDNMVETGFPSESFFNHFRLNPLQRLCEDVRSHAANFWVNSEVQSLQDLIPQILREIGSQIYPKSVDSLTLRYEWQEDQSLLGEDEFLYENEWLMNRWQWHSQFWSGHRAASSVPDDEAWKCRYCSFAGACLPAQQPSGAIIKEDMPG